MPLQALQSDQLEAERYRHRKRPHSTRHVSAVDGIRPAPRRLRNPHETQLLAVLFGPMSSAAGLLGGHAHFLHWGVIQISLANLIVIVLMLVVFALAVLVPFPHSNNELDSAQETPDAHN